MARIAFLLSLFLFIGSNALDSENDLEVCSDEKSSESVVSKAECRLSDKLIAEIQNFAPTIRRIEETVLRGKFKGRVWSDTAEFVDTIGPRMVGSEGLQKGIEYLSTWMTKQGFDHVYTEEVETPDWKRGEESLEMISPRYEKLQILGYGTSIGTNGVIEADAVVVRDYDELKQQGQAVKGKIVVYDHVFTTYHESRKYRYSGAVEAAKYGAVAALVAAVSNTAMGLPHTGALTYNDAVPKIPMASISIDTARMLGRMYKRKNKITLRFKMDHQNSSNLIKSSNVFGQLNGTLYPDQKVIVSGHTDSWDVGQGAQDDGAAVVMSILVISLLKELGLTPKRTILAAGWTSEENGLIGVESFAKRHKHHILDGKYVAAFESDSGLFTPVGFEFAGTDHGECIGKEMMKLFTSYNFTTFTRKNRVGSDVSKLSDLKVPTFDFRTANDRYFWYHHAYSDTMSALNSDELDLCLVVYASAAYIVAELSENLANPLGKA